MTALLINLMTVKNTEHIKDYAKRVGPIVAKAGGEIVTKGAVTSIPVGNISVTSATVLRFPSVDAIHDFLNDDDYAPLVPVRDAGADVNFLIVDEA